MNRAKVRKSWGLLWIEPNNRYFPASLSGGVQLRERRGKAQLTGTRWGIKLHFTVYHEREPFRLSKFQQVRLISFFNGCTMRIKRVPECKICLSWRPLSPTSTRSSLVLELEGKLRVKVALMTIFEVWLCWPLPWDTSVIYLFIDASFMTIHWIGDYFKRGYNLRKLVCTMVVWIIEGVISIAELFTFFQPFITAGVERKNPAKNL